MGVGKSTLGKKLAQKLNVDFIDSDQFIEKLIKMSIPEYFAEFGEEAFRKLEQDFLLQLDSEPKVIATGGGLPCFYENMTFMNKKGITVYLHRPPKELFQRLKNAKKERPLVAKLSEDELLDFISKQLKEREQFYNQAQFTITREFQTVDAIYALLV